MHKYTPVDLFIFPIDRYDHICYSILVRQRKPPLQKGSEDMEEMTMKQVARLIEWLKDKGFTDAQILECIEYISK